MQAHSEYLTCGQRNYCFVSTLRSLTNKQVVPKHVLSVPPMQDDPNRAGQSLELETMYYVFSVDNYINTHIYIYWRLGGKKRQLIPIGRPARP